MICDNTLVGVIVATTELRYKELEPLLRASANSFRAYVAKPPAFDFTT